MRPAVENVTRMLIVPFVSGRCVLIEHQPGQLGIPEWQTGLGRNYLHGAYLAPLEQAGVRLQQFHPFAQSADNAQFIVGWVDGVLYETDVERVIVPADMAAAQLRAQENMALANLVDKASASFRNQTDETYHEDVQILLEESYLAASNVFLGSGFNGNATQWRLARGLIADAIHRDGTFLDIGCANGLLMESMVAWTAENGHRLEPYGLDISARLAAVARSRLPQWANRIFIGNVMDWQPPHKFGFVSTGLDYVPEQRRQELAERLLADFVEEGGRLITTAYGLTKEPAKENWSVGDHLRAFGLNVAGEPARFDASENRWRRIAYIEKSANEHNNRFS